MMKQKGEYLHVRMMLMTFCHMLTGIFEDVQSTSEIIRIIRIIHSLNNSKSSGPIPTEILKLLGPNIRVPSKEIINVSFATGSYPDKLKIAEIVAVFKNKGDPR